MSNVSQLYSWREVQKENIKNNTNVSEGGPGAQYLSYNVFLGLSVIGGFFALDHLYLRSPLTFVAKIFINCIFFGAWWLYDASQAIFNTDIVKVFGLNIPGLGPGIGGGCLASDVPDKKHMSFLIYALALFFGGLFGLDSFIVGDKVSGFVRIMSLITVIFSPIAILWWIFNVLKFFFKTKDVVNKYWDFFGAPEPTTPDVSAYNSLITKIPFFGKILDPIVKLGENLGIITTQTFGTVQTFAEQVATDPSGAIASIASGPLQQALIPIVKPVLNSAKPITNTIQMGLQTADRGITLGQTALDSGTAIAERVIETTGEVAKGLSALAPLVSGVPAITSGISATAAQSALNKLQQGGMQIGMQTGMQQSNVLPYMLMGTIGLIAVSGFILTYRRSKKKEQDDSPPEPGVLRNSDRKERTA